MGGRGGWRRRGGGTSQAAAACIIDGAVEHADELTYLVGLGRFVGHVILRESGDVIGRIGGGLWPAGEAESGGGRVVTIRQGKRAMTKGGESGVP